MQTLADGSPAKRRFPEDGARLDLRGSEGTEVAPEHLAALAIDDAPDLEDWMFVQTGRIAGIRTGTALDLVASSLKSRPSG